MIKRIGRIPRTIRNIKRYNQILSVLIKHGLGDFLTYTNVYKVIGLSRTFLFRHKPSKSLSRWERIRIAIEELGPTFIKFGQILSNRPDVIPMALLKELEKLQQQVPPFPADESIELIEREIGKKLEDAFSYFDPVPIASASIAQVHEARLKDGTRIVVKVQRPKIKKRIETDLQIMGHLAQLIKKQLPDFQHIDPQSVVDEFAQTIRKELDFNIEASNIERFSKNFLNDKRLIVPKVYKEFSTKKILTMEFIDGTSIKNIDLLIQNGCDPKKIVSLGTDLVLKQIFKFGFFHADPHPGNVFILKDNLFCFLDYGMMGNLLPRHREYLANYIIAFYNKDVSSLARIILELTQTQDHVNIEEFERKVSELMDQFLYLPLREIDMGEVLSKTLEIVVQFKLKPPSVFYLLVKALVTIEGIARSIDPDFIMLDRLKLYAKKLLKEQFNPARLMKRYMKTAIEFDQLLRELPSSAREIISQAKNGKMKFAIEPSGFDQFYHKNDQISNRIAFSLVLSSLIIGSSLMVLAKIPPFYYGVPVIGLIGFIFAGCLALWLFVSILKSGRF